MSDQVGEVFSYPNVADNSQMIGVKFRNGMMNDFLLRDVMHEIACKIAERWIVDHYQEVIQNLRPEAIASLVAAEAAAEISKTLKADMPERVRTVVEREVYQRGLLGGMKRVR